MASRLKPKLTNEGYNAFGTLLESQLGFTFGLSLLYFCLRYFGDCSVPSISVGVNSFYCSNIKGYYFIFKYMPLLTYLVLVHHSILNSLVFVIFWRSLWTRSEGQNFASKKVFSSFVGMLTSTELKAFSLFCLSSSRLSIPHPCRQFTATDFLAQDTLIIEQ